MAARQLWCRMSVGFFGEYTLSNPNGLAVDITGWTFAQVLERVAGTPDVTLGMAATADDEGFFITEAAAGNYQVRILAATLVAIDDTTGDFTMFGDIIGTRPDATRAWIEDQQLEVTMGPTP
jgi:hypothetical protein